MVSSRAPSLPSSPSVCTDLLLVVCLTSTPSRRLVKHTLEDLPPPLTLLVSHSSVLKRGDDLCVNLSTYDKGDGRVVQDVVHDVDE